MMLLPWKSLSKATRIVKLIHNWSRIVVNEVENMLITHRVKNSNENQEIFEREVLYLNLGLHKKFRKGGGGTLSKFFSKPKYLGI